MILVSGATGSGKTTTLYTLLSQLDAKTTNISTVEDPVEFALPGVNQTQVDTRAGLSAANSLRAVLRQDPDVIMISELRDSETANLALQAAVSGHAVYAGTYARNAASTLTHLSKMDVEPHLVASTVRLIVGQRLVRHLCQKCRTMAKLTPDELARLSANFNPSRTIAAFRTLQESGALPAKLPALPDASPRETTVATTADPGKLGETRKVIPVPQDLTTQKAGILNQIAADPTLVNRPDSGEAKIETPQPAPSAAPATLGSPTDLTVYQPAGCNECNATGYSGRTGVFEVLAVSPAIAHLISIDGSASDIQDKAMEEGMMSLQEDGLLKALLGQTSIEEVLRLGAE